MFTMRQLEPPLLLLLLPLLLLLVGSCGALESPPLGALRRFEYVSHVTVNSLHSHNSSDDMSLTVSDTFRLSFVAFRQRFELQLEPNVHLLHADFHVVDSDNERHNSLRQLPLTRTLPQLRVYKGHVVSVEPLDTAYNQRSDSGGDRNNNLGWARITAFDVSHHMDLVDTGNDAVFEGVMEVGGVLYSIRQLDTYHRTRRPIDTATATNSRPLTSRSNLIIYRESDRVPTAEHNATVTHHADLGDHKCGSEALSYNSERALKLAQQIHHGDHHLSKRALDGCPTAIKILYMGIAADCTYVSNYGGSDAALKQIISDWNSASRLYETTFNIALGIIKVNLQSSCSADLSLAWNRPCSDGYTISQRLNDFTAWRASQGPELGLWHLMTRCSSGATVGISWLDTACQTQVLSRVSGGVTEYVSGTGVSSVSANEWTIVAHEIGHNFGAVHDCTSTTCGGCPGPSCQCCPCSDSCDCRGNYIMNPTSDVKTPTFSPCTQKLICQRSLSAKCLADPGTMTTITGNQCGNGVKEPGEDCDCGPADGPDCAKDSCCDGSTCKFKNGAKCDDFNDACCTGCQVKPAGVVCRPGRSICDIVEQCNGQDGACPADKFQPDLQQCTDSSGNKAQCASGDCTSRDLQCKSRGSVAGTTSECPGFSNQCGVYCQGTQIGQCIQLSGFFVDGSPCGYSGTCKAGECNQSGWSAILGWAQAHLGIVILLAVILGFFVLVCVGRGVQVALHNRKVDRLVWQNSRQLPPHRDSTNFPAAQAMVNEYRRDGQRPPSSAAPTQWVDPTAYNGDIANADEVDPETLAAIHIALAASNERDLPAIPPATTPRTSSQNTINTSQRNSLPPLGATRATARSPTRQSNTLPRRNYTQGDAPAPPPYDKR